MSPAKVTLSPKERELVTDASWILTKNRVIGKVYTLFGQLSEVYSTVFSQSGLPVSEAPGFHSPKIAKGEQYRELPWVMLDHPRHFKGTDIFAIRSFFWWGNYCSITLQLAGASQQVYATAIQQYFAEDAARCADWWIGIGHTAWEHHFEADNYQLLSEQSGIQFSGLPFIKLAKKRSLQEWDQLPVFFEKTYCEMLNMLNG